MRRVRVLNRTDQVRSDMVTRLRQAIVMSRLAAEPRAYARVGLLDGSLCLPDQQVELRAQVRNLLLSLVAVSSVDSPLRLRVLALRYRRWIPAGMVVATLGCSPLVDLSDDYAVDDASVQGR